jgi:hypothetical protein
VWVLGTFDAPADGPPREDGRRNDSTSLAGFEHLRLFGLADSNGNAQNRGMSTMLSDKIVRVSVSEAAEVIGCTEGRVRKLLIDGVLKGTKLNERAWAVDLSSAEKYARTPQKLGRPRIGA